MTTQEEQSRLKWVHTHGKVVRCWHEVDEYRMTCAKCGFVSEHYTIRVDECNPTLTTDYLFQRCEEEGFGVYGLARSADGVFDGYCIDGLRGYHHETNNPKHALLIAVSSALGYEEEKTNADL